MSSAEYEFSQLVIRYQQGKEYELTKYAGDTPERQEAAGRIILKTILRMSELWIEMTEEERQKYVDLL